MSMHNNPYTSNTALTRPTDGTLPTVLAFPILALTIYLWPTPAQFARHSAHASWKVLVSILGIFACITGLCAYLWGRVPTLNHALQFVSFEHLTPHPLTSAFTLIIALALPLLISGWAFALHFLAHTQQGQGSYRAQLYSVLLIATPLVLMLIVATLFLSIAPAVATMVRIPIAAVSIFLLLYSFLLFVPSLMGVQQLSTGKAVLCLVAILTVALLIIFCSNMFDNNQTSHGGGGDQRFKREKNRHARVCPSCGFSLEVYDQLHNTLMQFCPKCGNPLS